MKKIILWLFLGIASSISLFSCHSDDNPYDPDLDWTAPTIPGENLGVDEIHVVFKPDNNNSVFDFTVQQSEEKPIVVNWGDSGDHVKYEFSEADRKIAYEYSTQGEYLITIKVPTIKNLSIADESVPNIKELHFGNCASLSQFSMDALKNNLEKIDVTKCASLCGRATLIVNNPNFDFSGQKNVAAIAAIVNTSPTQLNFESFKANSISLIFNTPYVSSIKIKNNPLLKDIQIHGNSSRDYSTVVVNEIQIENTGVEDFYFAGLETAKLDLSSNNNLNTVQLIQSTFLSNQIIFSNSVKEIAINNRYTPPVLSRITALDLTSCSSLEILALTSLESLETLNISGLENLQFAQIAYCDKLQNIYGTLPDNDGIVSSSIVQNSKIESSENAVSENEQRITLSGNIQHN